MIGIIGTVAILCNIRVSGIGHEAELLDIGVAICIEASLAAVVSIRP